MSMLLRRHYDNSTAEGATEQVAPKPTPIKETSTKPEKATEEKKKPAERKLTRSEIMKMNVSKVRAYAEKQGIKGANAMSGAELKRILGDRLFEESE